MAPTAPPNAIPSCPLPTKYKPVVLSPAKFNEGLVDEPLPKVIALAAKLQVQ